MSHSTALYKVEGEIFEVLPGCGIASFHSREGAVYTLDRETPGVCFNDLRCGKRVRCEIARDFRRVVRAKLLNSPVEDEFSMRRRDASEHPGRPPAPPSVTLSPVEAFLKARVEVIKWLRSNESMNDQEIAKAISLTVTEVFLVRALESHEPTLDPKERDLTQAAPLAAMPEL